VSAEPIQSPRSLTSEPVPELPGFSAGHHRIPGAVSVALAGELDLATVRVADHELRHAQRTAHHVVLDLSALTFIDACGLNMILAADARARQDRGRLVVHCGSSCVRRLFELTGADRWLETTRAAVASAPAEHNGARPSPRHDWLRAPLDVRPSREVIGAGQQSA
jgi:anti-anti-sigma factor